MPLLLLLLLPLYGKWASLTLSLFSGAAFRRIAGKSLPRSPPPVSVERNHTAETVLLFFSLSLSLSLLSVVANCPIP